MVEKTIPNLKMYPFNTTMIGVLKGIAEYYDIPVSDAWLFGGSGHAFLINIHEQLCPSGPYCWKYEPFFKLLRNLGISMESLGFYTSESKSEERRKIEEILKKNIDAETPCSLLNMENQLISGYDDSHFIVQKPWPNVDLPLTPETLTFQTWKELGDEVHIDFFTFEKIEKADDQTIIEESLSYAMDLTLNPDRYRLEKRYYIGLDAYNTWINAVKGGHVSSHGNWWNGTVWGECRKMAAKYFSEIAQKRKGRISQEATELSNLYEKISQLIIKASDKKLADNDKIKALKEAQKTEKSCINKIEDLLNAL